MPHKKLKTKVSRKQTQKNKKQKSAAVRRCGRRKGARYGNNGIFKSNERKKIPTAVNVQRWIHNERTSEQDTLL